MVAMSQAGIYQDNIEHVVLLMMENHSFDQMLGALNAVHADLDGIQNSVNMTNEDGRGHRFRPQATTERQMLLDPNHDHPSVMRQIVHGNSEIGRAHV